jgi:hypothetical protein
MQFWRGLRMQRYLRGALLVMVGLGFVGCAAIGPRSINAGRGVYNEVINKTEDEQVLNLIVRNRYDETFGMISVASVTASLSFSVNAGVNAGFGNSDNYAGNLVPFSAGGAYEENPTISYTPMGGEEFLRKMLAPVSLTQLVLLSHMAKPQGRTLEIMAGRVNGLRNPFIGQEPPSPEYARMADLFTELRLGAVLDVVHGTANDEEYFVDIHGYADEYSDTVRAFLDLLGIEREVDGNDIVLPLHTAIGPSSTAMNIQPRSPLDLLRVYGAGIDIPPPHLEAGIVRPIKWEMAEKWRPIAIRSSRKRPDEAIVSILFRDWWFYVDATDARSKQAFMLLRTFIGMRLETPGGAQNLPVLTVPVR